MGMDDLSYLEQLMGGAGGDDEGENEGAAGGVWIVSPDGMLDEGMLRLVGKGRVLADALGTYVYLLSGGHVSTEIAQGAIPAGADQVLLASGRPAVTDLATFFGERKPQVVLFPRTRLGRELGPGLAQVLGGALCGYAADVVIDPVYQRVQAHQPVLDDAARQVISFLKSPAVVVLDTILLPAAFSEPWRTGQVQHLGLAWQGPAEYESIEYQAAPITPRTAGTIVGVGRGLRDEGSVALAQRLAAGLGGLLAGDVGALDAGWIDETQLVGLTGQRAAPRVYLALGIEGDTEHLAAVDDRSRIVAVQPDPAAPITRFADWNVIVDPVAFAEELLTLLPTPAE